jgi:inner membrane transporter RhtA
MVDDRGHRTATAAALTVLFAAMVSFQAGASIAKTLFPLIGPIGTVALRVALGAVLLGLTMRPWRVRIRQSTGGALLAYGISMGLMNLFFYLALSRLPQGIAVAIEFVGPLGVAVLSSKRPIDFLWISVALIGLTLLLPVTHIGSNTDLYGISLALAAGACWAIYIVTGKSIGAAHGIQATALGSVIAACVVVPIGAVKCGDALVTGSVLGMGLLVAVLSTAVPYTLEMFALARLPVRTFGVLMSVEPALGALTGYFWLGEHLTVPQGAAIALIMIASGGATACARDATTATNASLQ